MQNNAFRPHARCTITAFKESWATKRTSVILWNRHDCRNFSDLLHISSNISCIKPAINNSASYGRFHTFTPCRAENRQTASLQIPQFTPVSYSNHSAAALLAMQSAILATAIPSVCPYVLPSVCLTHTGTLSRRMKIGSRGLHSSFLIPTEKLSIIANRKLTTRFPTSNRRGAYVTPKFPQRVAQKVNLSFL